MLPSKAPGVRLALPAHWTPSRSFRRSGLVMRPVPSTPAAGAALQARANGPLLPCRLSAKKPRGCGCGALGRPRTGSSVCVMKGGRGAAGICVAETVSRKRCSRRNNEYDSHTYRSQTERLAHSLRGDTSAAISRGQTTACGVGDSLIRARMSVCDHFVPHIR